MASALIEIARRGAPSRRSRLPPGESDVPTLMVVSLDYAADYLLAAVRSVAVSEGPLQSRLHPGLDVSVQHVWAKPCLPTELLARFKALWDPSPTRPLVPGAPGFGN